MIDDPATFDIVPFKRKSLSVHWELMFTRALYTGDPEVEGGNRDVAGQRFPATGARGGQSRGARPAVPLSSGSASRPRRTSPKCGVEEGMRCAHLLKHEQYQDITSRCGGGKEPRN
jgi:hypothetical protein